MSSYVIAVEPAVSEETEEVTHLTKATHLIFRYIVPMTPRQGIHSARDNWRNCTISALILFTINKPISAVKY